MKRIAIFIDGTWNRTDAEHPTNVVRLSRCIFGSDDEGNTQQVIYSPGVGSGAGNNWLGKKMDTVFGGALGWGLLNLIEDVYRDLVFAYQPGDEVYIFGFSRGGFAARSLAGLIRSCGIPPRRHVARIPEAIARYVSRDKDTKPDDPSSYLFREDFAPYTATSASEFKWRLDRGDTAAINLKIAYLGVWDTVKALGIPAFLPGAKRFNAKYQFHDADLSRSVSAARHAIAIDERRKTFPASPWANLDRLNSDDDTRETPLYMQQWFPGNHGSVGGGGSRIGLSSVPLIWVTQGAEQAGLRIDWGEFDRVAVRFDPVTEALDNKFGPVGISGFLLNGLQACRSGPKEVEDIAVATLDRFRADAGYRPDTLNFVKDDLEGRAVSELDALRDFLVARDGLPTHEVDSSLRPRGWEAPRNAALPSDH
ncbi:uncharacterized protein (DUF2235 family) [Yoonia maricola]|uniref:Uncharacterized protein (DUF2235 family) n=1 Tax=Yoonia maricola TaxID=420999 RepID=A0A2M8WMP4_9RHOB|nr:DUF2235 domain-containing protein [Yoonia maricola]PJI92207.1 uncharacterized protein (DUF2235 family) [Yoonia maricola]